MENHTAKRGGTQSGSGGKKDLRELAGERRHKKRDSTSKKRPKELSQPSSGSDQPIQSQSVNPSGNKTPGTVTSKEPSLLQQLISKVSLKSHNSKETSPEAVGDEDIVEFPLKPLKDKGSSKSNKTGTKQSISKKQLESIKEGYVTPQIPVLEDFSTPAVSSNNLVSIQEKKSRRVSDQTSKINQMPAKNRGKSPSSKEKSRKYSSKEISDEGTKTETSPKTKSRSSEKVPRPKPRETKFSNSNSRTGVQPQPVSSKLSPSFSERILLARAHLKKVKDQDTVDSAGPTQKFTAATAMNTEDKTEYRSNRSQEMPVEYLWRPKAPLIRTKVSEEDLAALLAKQAKTKTKSASDQVLADKQETRKYGEELQERIQNVISSLRKVVDNPKENKVSRHGLDVNNPKKMSLKPVSKSEQKCFTKSIATEANKIPVKVVDETSHGHDYNEKTQTVQQLKEVLDSLSAEKKCKKVTFKENNPKIEVDWTESKLWKEGNNSANDSSTTRYSNCEIDQSSLVRASLIKSIVASRALEKTSQTKSVVEVFSKQNEDKCVNVLERNRDREPVPQNSEDSPIYCLPKPDWMVSIEKISDVQPHVRNKWDRVNGQLRLKLQAVDRLPAKSN